MITYRFLPLQKPYCTKPFANAQGMCFAALSLSGFVLSRWVETGWRNQPRVESCYSEP